MTIKEVEEITGLPRSNIRFYEKEKLIQPIRNESNGYRDYSQKNIEDINKIVYLCTLGISIEEIRHIMFDEISLYEIIKRQAQLLQNQISDLENAKIMCERMLQSENIRYENLEVAEYMTELPEYWSKNKSFLQFDNVSFLYMLGGIVTWGVITVACILIAILAFPKLPLEIPIQWSGSTANTFIDKKFIFAYPVSCVILRFFVRPFIWRWLHINGFYSDAIADYITNFLCFVAMSFEVFSIPFVYDIVKHVTVILFVDAIIFIGLLLIGWNRIPKEGFRSPGPDI